MWVTTLAVGGAAVVTADSGHVVDPIRYDADGKLVRPEYREWVFLGAGPRHDLRVPGRRPHSRTITCSRTCS